MSDENSGAYDGFIISVVFMIIVIIAFSWGHVVGSKKGIEWQRMNHTVTNQTGVRL